ncbi:MAG: DUF3021 domain-containing protein [Clostridia bacterium]|nr:DUF3021 domain-containing protein [Clostridia bacterium]
MKGYVKSFMQRGLIFGGFGPIILGVIYLILELTVKDFSVSGWEIFLGIISVYMLAFVHAGASVINQIESLPIARSSLIHFGILYVAYITCYLVNTWIPFDWVVIAIFTGIFVLAYFVVWITVYLIISKTSKAFNTKITKDLSAS